MSFVFGLKRIYRVTAGMDELPGLAYFVQWYVDDKYNIVYELAPPDEQSAELDLVTIMLFK